MIGCTVAKNSASGIRVMAIKFRLVTVSVSEIAHRTRAPTPVANGAPVTVGMEMVVVIGCLQRGWVSIRVDRRDRGCGPSPLLPIRPLRLRLRLRCGARSEPETRHRGWAPAG